MKDNIVEIQVENDVDEPTGQHSIKKLSASLNALERKQIKKFRKISSSLVLAMDLSDNESVGDSTSDRDISS